MKLANLIIDVNQKPLINTHHRIAFASRYVYDIVVKNTLE